MTNELQKILQQRVARVLRTYFGGTPEEVELASQAVMNEFNFVGGELREIADTSDADIMTDSGRVELAQQLVQFMRGN